MNFSVNTLEGNHTEIIVDVTPVEFTTYIEKAYQKIANDVAVDGFRKGKVPQAVFEKKHGKESLYQDALDALISDAYGEALEANKDIEPVAYPKVDLAKFEPENEIQIKIIVATKPEVKLGKYKGVKIDVMSTDVTDEDIQVEIAKMLERYSEMEIKEGAAAIGDTVVIDYEGFKDDVPFDGGKGENHSLELGSNSFIPGFEEQLVGATEGDNVSVIVTFPEAYHSEDLAGSDAVFKVLVHEVKTKVVPEITTEMIEKLEIEDVTTEDELKDNVSTRLAGQKINESEAKVRTDVINAVIENATMDIPEEMVDMQVDRMLQNFGQQLSTQGFDLEKYYQLTGSNEDGLRAQMAPDALHQIKETMVLEAVVVEEAIEISSEDIDDEIAKMAEMYQMPVEELDAYAPNIEQDLKMQKAVEILVSNHK